MTDWTDQYHSLMQQAAVLKLCDAQTAMYEQAINLADTHGHVSHAFDARMKLVKAGVYTGKARKAVAAYSWCLAASDKHPDMFHDSDILWEYKWIISHAIGFPEIPLDQRMALFDDMSQRYLRQDAGLRPVLHLKASFAIRMGRFDEARDYVREYKCLPKGRYNNCRACEQSSEVIEAVYLYQDDHLALKKAAPLLSGELHCGNKPYTIYSSLFDGLVRLGRIDEAEQYFKTGYAALREAKHCLCDIADYFRYAMISGKLEQAVKIFEKHLPWALENHEMEDQFQFYIPCIYLLAKLQANKGRYALRLPKTLKQFNHNTRQTNIAGLYEWILNEARNIAIQFDRRNQNDFFSTCMENLTTYDALSQRWLALKEIK